MYSNKAPLNLLAAPSILPNELNIISIFSGSIERMATSERISVSSLNPRAVSLSKIAEIVAGEMPWDLSFLNAESLKECAKKKQSCLPTFFKHLSAFSFCKYGAIPVSLTS